MTRDESNERSTGQILFDSDRDRQQAPTPPRRPPQSTIHTWSVPGSRFYAGGAHNRSEEHTSELQSLTNLVCRLLLEKKNRHSDGTVRNERSMECGGIANGKQMYS